ncbi:MAG: hypothetical protein K2M79_05440 [Muribaculaceae bacterium]|nr:hypothetical protein [Muribaculaceae bacterium]
MKRAIRKNILRLRGKIKRSDFLFSLRRRFIDRDLQREKKLMKQSVEKSPETVKAEIDAYKKYWKCRPDDYIRYGLFRKNLTPEEILDYIPMHYYYCDFYEKIFPNLLKKEDLENKLAQYQKFRSRGVKVPEVVAVIKGNSLSHPEDSSATVSLKTVTDALADGEKYFIKPTDGRCGFGIKVIKRRDGRLYDGEKIIESVADLELDSATEYIIQRQLIQREDLSAVNASTLNTLRTIVTYYNGKPRIVGIILRIGRAGAFVDNSGQGGISVAVDLETGRFAPYAGREHGGGTFDRHPDTGYVFAQGGIKDWPKVRSEIYDIVSKFTDYGVLGWDIAIGSDGVYAVEYNLGFGIEHAQTILGGMRRRLEISVD